MNRYLNAFLLTVGALLLTGVIVGFMYLLELIGNYNLFLALVIFVAVVGTGMFFLFLDGM